MFILSPTKSLQARLRGVIPSGAVDFGANYIETQQTATSVVDLAQTDGSLNSTSAVVVVAAPAGALRREVKDVWFRNAMAGEVEVLVENNNNGTVRPIVSVVLASGSTLYFADSEVPRVLDVDGQLLVSLGGNPTTTVFYKPGWNGAGVIASPDWVDIPGSQAVEIDGTKVVSATASFQQRTTDAGTSVQMRIWNDTLGSVAVLADVSTGVAEDWSGVDQRQTKDMTIDHTQSCFYKPQILGGNDATDVIGSAYIKTREQE